MKNLLFTLLAAVLLCGCGKDDGGNSTPCPVTGIEVPGSSEAKPVKPGDLVTIQGQGFTSESRIWMRSTGRAADVEATVTGYNAASITFSAPRVYGPQNVVLKHGGDEWVIGKMTFADVSSAILPKRLVRIVCTDPYENTFITEYSYDESGRLIGVSDNGGFDVAVDYSQSGKVIYKHDGTSGYRYSAIFNIDNGRVAGCVETEEQDYEDRQTYTTSCTYGGNGRLSGFKTSISGGINVHGTLTWDANGCLVKYSSDEKDMDGGYKYTLTFEPDMNVPNNLNLDLLGNVDFVADNIDDDWVLHTFLLGLAGKRSAYLPEKVTGRDDEGDTWYSAYEYDFDGEYISEIRIREEDDETTIRLYYEE